MSRLPWANAKRSFLVVGLLLASCAVVLLVLADSHVASAAIFLSEGDNGRLAQTSTALQACAPNWQVVQSPNPRTSNRLNSVAAVSSNDIWAVGYFFDFAQTPDHTLIMHWDGTQWTHVTSPNPAAGSYLEDVVALASNDVWAVGYTYISTAKTLVEHWDGNQWSVIPSPNQGPSTNQLRAIEAISPSDIWAIGDTPGSHNTVALHWSGTVWSVVPSLPLDFGGTYVMTDMAAVASNDVWAVGYFYPESGSHHTVILHWDGSQWTRVASPDPGAYVSRLYGITAVSANEVWAVGQYSNNGGASYQTLTMKWNGTSWSWVSSPDGSLTGYNQLDSIVSLTGGELWAVGSYHVVNFPTSPANTLIMSWNGSAWNIVGSPNGNRFNSELYGLAAVLGGDLWAVGRSYSDYNTPWDTLILRNICAYTPTPTVTGTPPTATPTWSPTPTRTSTVTQTVAATPTCGVTSGLRILIAYGDYTTQPTTLRNQLLALPGVQSVDLFRADSGTPTLQQLLQYDLVVPFSNDTSFQDPTALGNVLADYEDAYGIVVAFNFSWNGPPRWIAGRWLSGGYSPFNSGGTNIYSQGTLGSHNAAHPLMQGISTLSAFYRANLTIGPGATQVAAWNDSMPLVAYKGRAVGVSAYIGDSNQGSWSGDFARLIANAGYWLRPNPCSSGTATPAGTSTATATPVAATVTQTSAATPPTATGTRTPTPPNNTPSVTATVSATPTLCPLTFTDTHPSDYFYTPVRYLFCRNVVSGYGTEFRPYANTTRGQLTKIVALGFSLPINTTGGPHFTDVEPSNVFYPYVETAFNRGIIAGYGAEFRPNDNVTRGQLSKIVVLTAQWAIDNTGGPHFSDVPIGSTFYSYIETAFNKGIVSGYGSLFKPNNPATRGQICKIVYLAVVGP